MRTVCRMVWFSNDGVPGKFPCVGVGGSGAAPHVWTHSPANALVDDRPNARTPATASRNLVFIRCSYFAPDPNAMGPRRQPNARDDNANTCNRDRIDQSGERDASHRRDEPANERDTAAEDAVTDVIRHRHGGVPNTGWEQLHEKRRDRAV